MLLHTLQYETQLLNLELQKNKKPGFNETLNLIIIYSLSATCRFCGTDPLTTDYIHFSNPR